MGRSSLILGTAGAFKRKPDLHLPFLGILAATFPETSGMGWGHLSFQILANLWTLWTGMK